MRLIQGPTLKHLIFSRELDPRRTLRLLAQVAHALDAAHEADLIHRDVKPQNILIGQGDHAYLADFGLIKAVDDHGPLTGTGQFIGTIDYVAPEQIQGDPATATSDCYALTGVLFECLTGQVPFLRPNEAATLHAHVLQPPPKISELRPDLPLELDDVIAHGMAKDPAARPATAVELIMEAQRALGSWSPNKDSPVHPAPEQSRPTETRPREFAPARPVDRTYVQGSGLAGLRRKDRLVQFFPRAVLAMGVARMRQDQGGFVATLDRVNEPRTASQVLGRTLKDRYRVLEPISAGAMGAVYRAHDIETDTEVALKQCSDPHHDPRFEVEARLLSSLQHPRVVRIIDHFSTRSGQYLVMDLVAGSTWACCSSSTAIPASRSTSRSSTCARPARRSSTCTTSRSCTATSSRRT